MSSEPEMAVAAMAALETPQHDLGPIAPFVASLVVFDLENPPKQGSNTSVIVDQLLQSN